MIKPKALVLRLYRQITGQIDVSSCIAYKRLNVGAEAL